MYVRTPKRIGIGHKQSSLGFIFSQYLGLKTSATTIKMRFFSAAATVAAAAVSVAHAQDICDALDPADADKVSFQYRVSCENDASDCVKACVTFFNSPNECTASIGEFDGNEGLWVYDVLQAQTFKSGQDATSSWRDWTASFAPGTTSLPDPDPRWPGSGIYGVWDTGLFGFVYDIPREQRFVPDRIQFAISFADTEEVQAIFVDATC